MDVSQITYYLLLGFAIVLGLVIVVELWAVGVLARYYMRKRHIPMPHILHASWLRRYRVIRKQLSWQRIAMGSYVMAAIAVLALVGYIGSIYVVYPRAIDIPAEFKVVSSPERLVRGKYLVQNVAGCLKCHSTRDWTRFSGPILQGTEGMGGDVHREREGIPGTIYVPNITPYALADWRDEDIYRAVVGGVRKDGRPLFPLMPYPFFSRLALDDVEAIIAYLRTLKPIEAGPYPVPELEFQEALRFRQYPATPKHWGEERFASQTKHGEYLIKALGCADCHTPGIVLPVDETDPRYLSGGRPFHLRNGGTVRTMNLTPHPSGLGDWSVEMFVNRFRQYRDSSSWHPVAPNAMNSEMPWYALSQMTEADVRAIYAYLRTVPPVHNEVEKFTPGGRR